MENKPRKLSPRAPTVTLEVALQRVFRAYDLERLHAAPADAIAQAMGYANANSGSATTAIASLRYFGLLERPKDGFLAVSKAVETYKYAPDEGMKAPILLEFLKTPPLYQELLTKYPDGLPSSATLKYELIQKGFLPQAVDAVLAAFLQSVAFARYFEPLDVQPEQSPASAAQQERTEVADVNRQAERNPKLETPFNPDIAEGVDQIPIRLSGGRKAWIMIPMPFYESDKARLKAQIDVLFVDPNE
jgi:hypothetical protein